MAIARCHSSNSPTGPASSRARFSACWYRCSISSWFRNLRTTAMRLARASRGCTGCTWPHSRWTRLCRPHCAPRRPEQIQRRPNDHRDATEFPLRHRKPRRRLRRDHNAPFARRREPQGERHDGPHIPRARRVKPNAPAHPRQPPAEKPEALHEPPAQLRMQQEPRHKRQRDDCTDQPIDERHRARL